MQQWQLSGADLRRARAAERLQHEFDANLDAAALILDLQDEIRRLKSLMAMARALPIVDV